MEVFETSPEKEQIHVKYSVVPTSRNTFRAGATRKLTPDNGLYWRYFYTIDDATHVLTPDGIKPTRRHTWKMVKRTLGNPRSLPRLIRQTLARSG